MKKLLNLFSLTNSREDHVGLSFLRNESKRNQPLINNNYNAYQFVPLLQESSQFAYKEQMAHDRGRGTAPLKWLSCKDSF